MTGITRKQAAQALAAYFGTEPSYRGGTYSEYQVKDKEGKVWALRSDASIRCERTIRKGASEPANSDYSVEVVSPVLTYEEIPKLQEVIRILRGAGAKVNKSCGLHVHIDAVNHNRNSLKNLLGIMYAKEDMLFQALQVNPNRVNEWCKKVREPMLVKARRLSSDETKDLTRLENIWYENSYSSRSAHYNETRYYALNLHSVFYRGTVEFRCYVQ